MMEVIGVGYGRTGTYSLKLALEQLGYKVFHTKEMFHSAALFDMWHTTVFSLESAQGGALGAPELRAMADDHGFTASTDMPMSLYFKQLRKLYPRAKFVLTTRSDEHTWFASWTSLMESVALLPRFAPWLPRVNKIDRYNRWLLAHMHDDDAYLTAPHPLVMDAPKVQAAYRDHNRRVKRAFLLHPGRLLDYTVGSGWEPLCSFLHKPVPVEPFPHSNSSAEVALQLQLLVVLANAALLVALYFLARLLRRVLHLPRPPVRAARAARSLLPAATAAELQARDADPSIGNTAGIGAPDSPRTTRTTSDGVSIVPGTVSVCEGCEGTGAGAATAVSPFMRQVHSSDRLLAWLR